MATPVYLTWKGVTDSSLGVVTRSMRFIQSGVRNEITQIEGRDGSIPTLLGREPYTIRAEIELMPTANLDNVIAWLSGTGQLVRSDDSLKYVNAIILNQIDYEKVQSTKQATVEFYVYDPYRYLLSESVQTVTTFPATIANSGTAIAKPLLKITGSGTVNLVLNGISFTYVFPSGETYVYIDCNDMFAYYDSVTAKRDRSLTIVGDDFMTLSVGNNTLSLTSGTVSEIVVTKRTRYL